jgi:hypothetical protein
MGVGSSEGSVDWFAHGRNDVRERTSRLLLPEECVPTANSWRSRHRGQGDAGRRRSLRDVRRGVHRQWQISPNDDYKNPRTPRLGAAGARAVARNLGAVLMNCASATGCHPLCWVALLCLTQTATIRVNGARSPSGFGCRLHPKKRLSPLWPRRGLP